MTVTRIVQVPVGWNQWTEYGRCHACGHRSHHHRADASGTDTVRCYATIDRHYDGDEVYCECATVRSADGGRIVANLP